jgi:hypothetical protein
VSTEQKAPKDKTRVIGVDLFDHEDYHVGDYDTPEEAFEIADDHNKARTGPMDDVFYVYNDQGAYIRGNEAVGQEVSP